MTRNNFLKRLGLMAIAAVVAPFVPKLEEMPIPTDCKWLKNGDIAIVDGIEYNVHDYNGRRFYLRRMSPFRSPDSWKEFTDRWLLSKPAKPDPVALYRNFKPKT